MEAECNTLQSIRHDRGQSFHLQNISSQRSGWFPSEHFASQHVGAGVICGQGRGLAEQGRVSHEGRLFAEQPSDLLVFPVVQLRIAAVVHS